MKKILIIGLAIVLSFGLIGCEQEKEDTDLTVENDADEVVGDFIKVSETGDSDLLGSILDDKFKHGKIVMLIQRYEDYEKEYDDFDEFEDAMISYITDEAEYSYNNEDIEVDYEQEKIIVYDERIEEHNKEKEVLDEASDGLKEEFDDFEVSNTEKENSKKTYFFDFTSKQDPIFDVLENQFILELEIVDNYWVIKDLIMETSTIVEPSDLDNIYNRRDDDSDGVTNEKYFKFDKDTGTITDYNEDGGADLVIPSEIDGFEVTDIGQYAFRNNKLTSVEIPDSVIEIAGGAFRRNELTSVKIGASVTEIGQYAFKYNDLESVINYDGEESTEYIYYSNSDETITIHEYFGSENELKIPSKKEDKEVAEIGVGAFAGNELTSVEIPDSLTEIGQYAFGNNELTEVEIPDSVTEIGGGAFAINELTSVKIGDSVTEIGGGAFMDNELTEVELPDDVNLKNDAFDKNLKDVYENNNKQPGIYAREDTDSDWELEK